jgi:Carbohydrate esterase, sialic acid-specific acetylesterase
MKKLTLFLCAVFCLGLTQGRAAEGKHLFILSGQSNMAGLDPNASFTPAVQKAFGMDNVIVIKDAQGGQPIRKWFKDWKPAGDNSKDSGGKNGILYDRLMGVVKPAIEGQKIATVTFVWMQGEADAKGSHGDVYGTSFEGIIKQLQADLNREDIYFVIGRISDMDMENKAAPHWTMVRDAQVKLAEGSPRGAWVDTDDLSMMKDNLHYTKDGYKTLGQRFADKAIALIQRK